MINSGNKYDFQGQPYFALAGIGLEENHTWDNVISEMRGRHRIPDGELKSKSLTSKPRFSAEVINTLIETEAQLFIEIVDKRFFICMTITCTLLLAKWMGYKESKQLYQIRNTFADFLYFHSSEQVLSAFVTFCLSPSDSSLKASFASLLAMSSHTNFHPFILPIATAFSDTVKTAQDEYEKLNKKKKKAWENFLPNPDLNKHNKQIWMLPNLSSFTNIYARLNLYRGGKLNGVTLVHDQQLELDNILQSAKAMVENLNPNSQLLITPYANYRFKEQASLEFAQSHNITGIQLADIVAGASMRYFRDIKNRSSISPDLKDAMQNLITVSNGKTGYGLMQVVPGQFRLIGQLISKCNAQASSFECSAIFLCC